MLEIGLLTGRYIYNLKFRRIWMNVELSTSFPFLGALFGEIPYSIYFKMTWMCWLWLSPHNLSCSWEAPFLAPTGPLFAGKMALPHNLSIAEHLKVFIRDQRWAASQAVANPRWRHHWFGWGNLQIWLGKYVLWNIVKPLKKEWWFPAFPADFDFPGHSWLIASWFSIIYVLINHDFHEPEAQEVSPEGCFHTFCCQGSCLRLRAPGPIWRIQRISSTAASAHWDSPIDIYDLSDLSNTPTSSWIFAKKKTQKSKKTNEVSNNAPLFLGISFLPHQHQKWAPAPKRDCE